MNGNLSLVDRIITPNPSDNVTECWQSLELLANSSILPDGIRGNPANLLLVFDAANRYGYPPLAIAQNVFIIHGKLSFVSSFLIGLINRSGRFDQLKFEFVGNKGADDWGCRAWARLKESNERVDGPVVTIGMAKAEGWYSRNGSKWKTLPELMLRYRAAAFFSRTVCPEITSGLHTVEEYEDMGENSAIDIESVVADSSVIEAELLEEKPIMAEGQPEPEKPAESEKPAEPAPAPESDVPQDSNDVVLARVGVEKAMKMLKYKEDERKAFYKKFAGEEDIEKMNYEQLDAVLKMARIVWKKKEAA